MVWWPVKATTDRNPPTLGGGGCQAAGECEWDRPVDTEDSCLLWDTKWMDKLYDAGTLHCGMGHMIGNFARGHVPTWMRGDDGKAEYTVKDLKMRLAKESALD